MHRTEANGLFRPIATLTAVPSARRRRTRFLAALLLPLATNLPANAAERNLLGGSTPEFVEMARRVQHGGADEKAEFARVSLDEMAYAFLEEAQRARDEPPDPKKPRNEEKDPRKWAAATDAYAGRLMDMSESIVLGAHVDVRVAQEGAVILVISGRNVIVSGPRIDRPEVLERRIMERICLDADCLQLAGSSFAPADYRPVGGRWSFEDPSAPIFSTSNGLNFLFEDSNNLAGKERACLAVAQELEEIMRTLKDMMSRRALVDWDAIAVINDPARTTQQLRINRNGDFVQLPLPQLALTPYVLQSALPWLHSQIEGRYRQHYVQLPPNTFN
ncbi:MAG: hypothetical protein ACT4NU_04570 [Chromatiales bacterium]